MASGSPKPGARGLARQLAFLGRRCNVVPLTDALRALDRDDPLPPRAVALTFDDGYRDQLELAAPMLARLGLPATFFLVPGLLDGTARAWWELLAWTFTRSTRDAVVWEGRTLGLRDDGQRRRRSPSCLRSDAAGPPGPLPALSAVGSLPPTGIGGARVVLDWTAPIRLPAGLHVASHSPTTRSWPKVHTIPGRDLTRARRLEGELDVR